MRSPIFALTWDIWLRNRKLIWLVVGLTLFGALFNLLLPGSYRAIKDTHDAVAALNVTLEGISLLLIFSIFGYTEFNSQKESIGFPHRLFVLPVKSLVLVALPMSLGVAAAELIFLVWTRFAPVGDGAEMTAVVIGTYMVFYQAILWVFPGLRAMRMVVLGVVAIILLIVGSLPSFPGAVTSVDALMVKIAGAALLAFLIAWMDVVRQRHGGGQGLQWHKPLIERIAAYTPRRIRPFRSSSRAQFWFEWRSSGFLLPLLVTALLLLILGPLSWLMRGNAEDTLRILIAALAMPLVLALPVGRAFSKPDSWSSDLTLPPFVAVRPLATDEMVAIKMKVAALSASMSWMLVFTFLSAWLSLWANLGSIVQIQLVVSRVYGVSLNAQYAIVVLFIFGCVFLTWRFQVNGLWIGLSGNKKLFTASAIPYGFAPIGLIVPFLLLRPNSAIRVWISHDPNRALSSLLWIAALAVLVKFSIAVFSWKRIPIQRFRQYLPIWLASTGCLVALAVLLSTGVRGVLPVDAGHLRTLLILIALLGIPLARLGLAPSSLARNRHQ